jgi:hypothetical protein
MEESVKTTNSHRVYDINNQLLFEDDRLYITRIPYENGRQVGFSEKIDVTDEVMEALLKAYYKKMDAAKQATIVRQLTTQL